MEVCLCRQVLLSELPMYLCFCSSFHYSIILDITLFSILLESFVLYIILDFINGSFHLLQLDGNSHVIYAEEEAAGTRLLIDGRTCLLQVKRVYFDLKSSICFYYGRGN
jgi:hypothetical protein